MALKKRQKSTTLTIPVEKIARLIRTLDAQQKAILVQLVPELQSLQVDTTTAGGEQTKLLAYFEDKMSSKSGVKPLRSEDLFISGLTAAEFFALPEEEQDRIWNELHWRAEQELTVQEHAIQIDAVPAG
jgi:hypothetical protein